MKKMLLLIPAALLLLFVLVDMQEVNDMNSPSLKAAQRGEIPQIDKIKHKRTETAVFAMG